MFQVGDSYTDNEGNIGTVTGVEEYKGLVLVTGQMDKGALVTAVIAPFIRPIGRELQRIDSRLWLDLGRICINSNRYATFTCSIYDPDFGRHGDAAKRGATPMERVRGLADYALSLADSVWPDA